MIVAGLRVMGGLYAALGRRRCSIFAIDFEIEYAVWIAGMHDLYFVLVSGGIISSHLGTLSWRLAQNDEFDQA